MPEENTAFWVEPLGAHHQRAAFCCGVAALDDYLHTQAGQDLKKRVAAVFVLTADGSSVAGYYTLSQYSVEVDTVPEDVRKKLPKYPLIPVTLLRRFAISKDFQGRGLGEYLLMDALHRSLIQSRQVASAAIVVDAKDERAAKFYARYGFILIPRVPSRLFLPMPTVAKMFSGQP